VGLRPLTHQAEHACPSEFQRIGDNHDRAPVQCRGFGYGSHLSFSDSISARTRQDSAMESACSSGCNARHLAASDLLARRNYILSADEQNGT
jgi:hypothetical protein